MHGIVLMKLTLRAASADALRQEVMQSSWYDQFRADVRSNVVVRAVEGSLSRVAAATAATASGTWAVTTWTTARIASASRSLRCAVCIKQMQQDVYAVGFIRTFDTPQLDAANPAVHLDHID